MSRSRTKRKHSWRVLTAFGAGLALLLLTGLLTQTSATAAPAGDGPPGFWWGTDSLPVTVPGPAPYQMPFLGGAYGGYIGMTGNWAYYLGCSGQEHFLAFSATNNAQAHTNYVTYHTGVGSGAYWFMGGPGMDPNYNGTTTEASSWGARQAARARPTSPTATPLTTTWCGWISNCLASRPRPTTAGTASIPRRAAAW